MRSPALSGHETPAELAWLGVPVAHVAAYYEEVRARFIAKRAAEWQRRGGR